LPDNFAVFLSNNSILTFFRN